MDELTGAWIKLSKVNGLGLIRTTQLLSVFNQPQAILAASASQLEKAGIPSAVARRICDANNETDVESHWLQASSQHHIIHLHHPDYPSQLGDIDQAPTVLYGIGDINLLQEPQIAIVGSRNMSADGRENAYAFAQDLSRHGLVICSGLAKGVDSHAHQACVDNQRPTIAVMATGIDQIYPAQNQQLAQGIVNTGGLLLTENPLGTAPKAGLFPKRNRIISGLSFATLVIEASKKSGSLITARHAMEQGREVMAIPSSIHNPHAKGCHQLIRTGAKLVETSTHVLEEIAPLLRQALMQTNAEPASSEPAPTVTQTPVRDAATMHTRDENNNRNLHPSNPENMDQTQQALLGLIAYRPISVDELVKQSGLPADDVASTLLLLELNNHIQALGSGFYTRLS